MDASSAERASAVLGALADLAPSAEQHASGLTVPTEWFRWLPLRALQLFHGTQGATNVDGTDENRAENLARRVLKASSPEIWGVAIDRHFGERLAAVDQIRSAARSLRAGWLFLAGRVVGDDGRTRRLFHPLVQIPVRVQRGGPLVAAQLIPAGDAEVTELVNDHDLRHRLESDMQFGGGALFGSDLEIPAPLLARLDRLKRFARSAAGAAGFPASKVVAASDSPDGYLRSDELVIVAGVAVYAIHEAGESSRASSLRAWAQGPLDTWTAFHSIYLDPGDAPPSPRSVHAPIESPYLLTPVQREAVANSRAQAITLISGAPGTGKSHTIAAIACDALAQGQRVLVAAKSDATVDALLDLFERSPGADPVVFGSNERREALANRLSEGQLQPVGPDAVSTARDDFAARCARRDELHAYIADRLGAEALLDQPDAGNEALVVRSAAPGLFDAGCDLALAGSLLAAASGSTKSEGWLAPHRRRRALGRLARLTGVAPSDQAHDVGEIRAALHLARAMRAAAELQAQGGLELGNLWQQLLSADDEARRARGKWLAVESRSEERLNAWTLRSVAALATALRSGRAARREQLSRLDDDKLTRALPLWVGTLGDVDDLLPPVAALFDLVVLDEASSIDQPLAATALLRGRRAVVAGDPRQLRQVSFVSDTQLRAVATAHGLDESPVLAARLDIRRNSTFDLAAGAAPVLVLSEHFRSYPHLVEFVARRIYDGKVQIATRSPTTESQNCVAVVRTVGTRDKNGVVAAEVERAVVELKALSRAGIRSAGVVTPFRAQADAIEQAVLAAFSADQLESLDLRVGTVHAFQGNERDVVIASLGLGPEDSATSWRFLDDPHLFAVFMTRARRRMTILRSADPPEGGLMAAYLAQTACPPGPPDPAAVVGSWARALAEDLCSAGVPATTAYPTGRHVIDVCLSDERRNVDIECQVHTAGPDAHIERRLALSRSGWEFVEAYPSRWGERRGELVVELVGMLKAPQRGRASVD